MDCSEIPVHALAREKYQYTTVVKKISLHHYKTSLKPKEMLHTVQKSFFRSLCQKLHKLLHVHPDGPIWYQSIGRIFLYISADFFYFFCSVGPLIKSGYMDSCLAAQNHFLLFKGPSSSKQILNQRKCRGIKGLSIYITHIPPPLSFYSTFNSANACRAMQNIDDKKAAMGESLRQREGSLLSVEK